MTEIALPRARPVLAEDRDRSIGLRWSIGAHLAFFIFILLKTFVFPSKPVLIVPTLRVDIVGLPDLMKSELKNSLPAPVETTQPKKAEEVKPQDTTPKPKAAPIVKPVEKAAPDEMVLKPKQDVAAAREKRLKAAMDRIKALSKIDAFDKPAPKSQLIKGNAISKGTSLSGEARESLQATYYDALRDRLHDNWNLPIYLSRQNLSAQVALYIDQRGHLVRFIFKQSSGNAQFDSAIKKDIADSQPFPSPPEGILSTIQSDGISVGFPL